MDRSTLRPLTSVGIAHDALLDASDVEGQHFSYLAGRVVPAVVHGIVFLLRGHPKNLANDTGAKAE